MVPAPVERSELPGHRQRSQIPQHRQWGALPLSQRCGCGSKISGIGSVTIAALTRAPRRAPIPASSDETDLHRPARRRRGCWPTSTFSNCCWQLRGRTMELGRSAPMLTSASPGRAAAMVPAPVERSELPGHRQRRQILQHRQWGALPRSLSAAARGRKDQRNLEASTRCPHARTRGGEPIPASSDADPTCTGRLGGAAAAGRRRHFF